MYKSLRVGGQMEQSSLSKVQYPKPRGHNKSEVKLKRQLNVEVEVQETLGLVAP
jgi:hypothetical protein